MTNSSSCPLADDPDVIAKRLLQRAHNRDGLPEIVAGLNFLAIGALSYAQALLPHQSILFTAVVVGLGLLIPVLSIGSTRAVRWLRRRYLVDRVGYVESRPLGRKQIGIGIAVAAVAGLSLLGAVTQVSQPDRWILAGTGLFGGALAALCGRLPRFVIGGVIMAATGAIVAFSGVSLQTGFAILFGFTGLLALGSGSVAFLRFIRQPSESGE